MIVRLKIMLHACVISLGFFFSAYGQDFDKLPFIDDSAKTNYINLDREDVTIGLSDASAFGAVWPKVLNRAGQDARVKGRLVLRRFKAKDWPIVSRLSNEPFEPRNLDQTKAEESFFVDFLCNHIDLEYRFDYCLVKEEDLKDFAEIQSADGKLSIGLFETFSHPAFVDIKLFGSTIDYEVTGSKRTGSVLSRPQRNRRTFPRILDLRTIGLFSFAQWINPTSLEDWEKAMKNFRPLSAEHLDSGLVLFSFVNDWILRSYVVNTTTFRIVEYAERPIDQKDERFLELSVFKGKSDHVKVSYDEKGNPRSFVVGSISDVWKGTFVEYRSELGDYRDALLPMSFTSPAIGLKIDRSIENDYELLLDLGLISQ